MVTAVALLAGLFTLAPWSPVGAQEGYPPAPEQSQAVSKTVLAPGESLTVSGVGFGPGAAVEVVLRSVEARLGSTTADSLGYFLLQVTIPCGREPGPHRVVSVGRDPSGVALELSSPVTILDVPCRPVSLETGPGTDPAAGPAPSEGASAPTSAPRQSSGDSQGGGEVRGGGESQAAVGGQGRDGDLPRTGSPAPTLPLVLVAAGLIVAGAVALALTYRGRSTGTG